MANKVKLGSIEHNFGQNGRIAFTVPENLAKKLIDSIDEEKQSKDEMSDCCLSVFLGECCGCEVDKVIFNDKTTIVFWNDHTKTVVKCQDGDTFSEEAGIALCFMKKMLGNKGNYNKVLREALEKAKRQGE